MEASSAKEEARRETFRLRDRAATQRWGEALGARLQVGQVVALIGDLGAGKTTLTQAIARGLGVTTPVTSPTFTLVHEYPGRIPLFHFDAYRLERPEDLADLAFDEYLERAGVVVIEWADRVAPLLQDTRLTLTLEIREGNRGNREQGTGNRAEGRGNRRGSDAEEEEAPRRVIAEAIGPGYAALLEGLPNRERVAPATKGDGG